MPEDTPHKWPPASMVASDDGPVDHVPPPGASCSDMDCPSHTIGPPVIAGGGGSTVTSTVTEQPPAVYVIVVMPGDAPYTMPEATTVAAAVLLLLHVPPLVASLNAVVDPTHMVVAPPMGDGNGFTVTIVVAGQPEAGV